MDRLLCSTMAQQWDFRQGQKVTRGRPWVLRRLSGPATSSETPPAASARTGALSSVVWGRGLARASQPGAPAPDVFRSQLAPGDDPQNVPTADDPDELLVVHDGHRPDAGLQHQ